MGRIVNNYEINRFYSDTYYGSFAYVTHIIGMKESERIKKYKDIEDWYISCCLAIDRYFINSKNDDSKRIKENIDLVEKNIFDSSKFKNIYMPYSEDIDMPFEIEHYDIISSRLNVIVGEELLRTSEGTYKIVNVSDDVNNRIQEKKISLLIQYINNVVEKAAQNPGNPEEPVGVITEDGRELQDENQLVEYLNSNMAESYDKILNKLYKYLYEYNNIKIIENKGLLRFLSTGIFACYVGDFNNDIQIRLVNLYDFYYYLSPNNDNIEDAMFIKEQRYMGLNDIFSEFGDYLTDKDREHIIELYNTSKDYGRLAIDFTKSFLSQAGILVTMYEWKSPEVIKIISVYNEETEEYEDIVLPEDYKGEIGEIVKEEVIHETHCAVRIGYDLFIKMQKINIQKRDIDNYNKIFSHYVGIKTNECLVDKVKPLQALYNVISYLLKLAFFRAKGKGIIMDIAQLPVSQGWDLDKWLYYMDLYGIAVIDSMAKNNMGERALFNQFQNFDLSLGNSIQSYINELEYIRQQVIFLTGVSEQRLGNIKATETLGGVERSVTQSMAITEPILNLFRTGMKRIITRLFDVCKTIFHKGKKIQYFTTSGTKEILELDDDNFFLNKIGVIVTDVSSYQNFINTLKSNAAELFKSGALKISDFARIMKSNSIDEIEQLIEITEQRMEQQQQQAQQQQVEMQQQQIQIQQQQQQFEQQYKMALLDLEKQKIELEKLKILSNQQINQEKIDAELIKAASQNKFVD